MVNRKLLFVIVGIVTVAVAGWWLLFSFHYATIHEHSETYIAHTNVAKTERISVWQNEKEKVIEQDNPEYTKLANILLSTLERVNLQGKCAIFEGDISMLKRNGKVIELVFKNPVNITINQWIKPEDRDHILTDENGYRVLTNVQKVVFVLEGRHKGHILTKSVDKTGYGCWAIRKGSGEIDKMWIDEIENVVSEMLDYCGDKKLYPETVGRTYFDDSEEANNTVALLIKTYKPLTEEQIQILRNSGVKELSASELETVYHSLIEEDMVDRVKNLDFVESVYPYKIK